MYRVIIVDDEQWALIGIRKFLQRGSDQFQVIYETTNPIEALDAICSMQPDLVFTDIRMPEISGIDLIEKTRQRGVSTEFVIVSGFSEFSFAQQALRVGALDYLLKPLDVPNAHEILLKIQRQMDARHHLDDLNLYGLLISDQSDAESLIRTRFAYPPLPWWQAATVYLSSDVQPILHPALPEGCRQTQLQLGPHKVVLIINSPAACEPQVRAALEALGGDILSCGLSPAAQGAENLTRMLRLAESAVSDVFVYPEQRIFPFHPAQPAKVYAIWQQIRGELRARNTEPLHRILNNLPAQFILQKLTADDALNLWNLLAESIHEFLPGTEALTDITPLSADDLVEKFGSLRMMCQYLVAQLAEPEDQRDGSANQHFKRLLQFVDAHYTQSLNLQELCDQYFINVSYCCELFRKETQMTFTQYITRLRMDLARELLMSTSLPLKEICERIGYNDYFYFNKAFKKNIGCTPSEYRRREEASHE